MLVKTLFECVSLTAMPYFSSQKQCSLKASHNKLTVFSKAECSPGYRNFQQHSQRLRGSRAKKEQQKTDAWIRSRCHTVSLFHFFRMTDDRRRTTDDGRRTTERTTDGGRRTTTDDNGRRRTTTTDDDRRRTTDDDDDDGRTTV